MAPPSFFTAVTSVRLGGSGDFNVSLHSGDVSDSSATTGPRLGTFANSLAARAPHPLVLGNIFTGTP
ncbi:hypothetical protein HPP92_007744 [Vanilla planifolia]|uniref:Uncharacterized protein n=1 Tax=Vanilla planifolia TaxID=51239 RepID=A0A835VAH2_VANPL|nr:hypothetical protein HPP92_007882 [Vanilla planifolia]KAG0490881.1 hypothetical protein HPP92_007744 [Vanilla planifolia]